MYNSQSGPNYKAVESVVRIVRELDRYHGFVATPTQSIAAAPTLPPPLPEVPLALPAPDSPMGKDAATD